MQVINRKQRRQLTKNTHVDKKYMKLPRLLDLAILVAEVLHDVGFRFKAFSAGHHGIILSTLYGRDEVRFHLNPVTRKTITGLITYGVRHSHTHLGVIIVADGKINVISDMDEAIPSLTLSLREGL